VKHNLAICLIRIAWDIIASERQSKTPLEGEEIPVEGSIVPITFSEIRRIPAIEICIQESTTDENDRVKREMIESDLHFFERGPIEIFNPKSNESGCSQKVSFCSILNEETPSDMLDRPPLWQ
jgi:hypothetical protein